MNYILEQAKIGFAEGWSLFWSPFTGFIKVAKQICAKRKSEAVNS